MPGSHRLPIAAWFLLVLAIPSVLLVKLAGFPVENPPSPKWWGFLSDNISGAIIGLYIHEMVRNSTCSASITTVLTLPLVVLAPSPHRNCQSDSASTLTPRNRPPSVSSYWNSARHRTHAHPRPHSKDKHHSCHALLLLGLASHSNCQYISSTSL